MITKYLIVFLISMVPLIELRGAIPYAVAFHIPTLPAYLIARHRKYASGSDYFPVRSKGSCLGM